MNDQPEYRITSLHENISYHNHKGERPPAVGDIIIVLEESEILKNAILASQKSGKYTAWFLKNQIKKR